MSGSENHDKQRARLSYLRPQPLYTFGHRAIGPNKALSCLTYRAWRPSRDVMPGEKLLDGGINFYSLGAAKSSVLPAGNSHKLMEHADLVESLLKPDGMAIRHRRISAAMNSEDRG